MKIGDCEDAISSFTEQAEYSGKRIPKEIYDVLGFDD